MGLCGLLRGVTDAKHIDIKVVMIEEVLQLYEHQSSRLIRENQCVVIAVLESQSHLSPSQLVASSVMEESYLRRTVQI